MRSVVADRYRLRPDRRFLDAFGVLDGILTGRPKQNAVAAFEAGRWRIAYAGHDIGTIPEFPEYRDFMQLLSAFATSEKASARVSAAAVEREAEIRSAIDRFDRSAELEALRQLDAQWQGRRSSRVLPLASRALALLAVQQVDSMEVGDAVAVQAIAVTAAAKALCGDDSSDTESLLAHALGYDADAESLAGPGSPLRAWIGGTVPVAPPASKRVLDFLQMRRLAESGDTETWSAWRAAHSDVGALDVAAAGLSSRTFGTHHDAALLVPALAYAEVAVEGGDAAPVFKHVLGPAADNALLLRAYAAIAAEVITRGSTLGDEFERVLGENARRYSGSLFGPEQYRAYYRSFFYSGVYGYGLHSLDWLSSTDAAGTFRRSLGEPKDALAAQYVHWFDILVQRESHKADDVQVFAQLRTMPELGQPAIARTLGSVIAEAPYSSTITLDAVRLLFSRSDTRLLHRKTAAAAARGTLLDLPLFEKIYAAAIRSAGGSAWSMRVWQAVAANDFPALRSLGRDSRVAIADRVAAAEALVDAKMLDEAAYRAVMKPVADGHTRFSLVRKYVDHLGANGDLPEARRVLTNWIALHADGDLLELSDARLALAGTFEREGNIAAARRALEPAIPVWKENAIARAARYLYASGERAEALDLAKRNLDRYPDSAEARCTLAEIYWRDSNPGAAAAVLVAGHFTDWDWRDAGQRFATVFESQPDDAAAAAFAPLAAAANPFSLAQFVLPLSKSGRSALAFRLDSTLRYKGRGQLDLIVVSYQALKQWKGEAAARQWLGENIPAAARSEAADILYGRGAYDELWSFIDQPDSGRFPEFTWLMRAAAAQRSSDVRSAHGQAVLTHFKTTTIADSYARIGRYLAGLTGEAEVLLAADTPQRRCETAYYVGLKAFGEGRYADASDWFRVAVETGQNKQGEYEWAKDQLARWAGGQRSFDRAVREQ